MNRLIAAAASALINAAFLAVIATGIELSDLPRGQVVVTELSAPDAVRYAQSTEPVVRSGLPL